MPRGHDLAASACTDYVVAADIGELAPGHRLVARGVCQDGRRLRLYYAWTPGLTEPMGEDSDASLTVGHGADVLPRDLPYAGAYDTGDGEFDHGETGYTRPPASAPHVWFDFYAVTDDDHRACRLTIDLATRRVQVER